MRSLTVNWNSFYLINTNKKPVISGHDWEPAKTNVWIQKAAASIFSRSILTSKVMFHVKKWRSSVSNEWKQTSLCTYFTTLHDFWLAYESSRVKTFLCRVYVKFWSRWISKDSTVVCGRRRACFKQSCCNMPQQEEQCGKGSCALILGCSSQKEPV